MLNQQGNQLQLFQLNQQLDNAEFQYCKEHQAYFQQQCSFCHGGQQPETFHNTIVLDQKMNYIILEIDEKPNIQLFNAGISSYDQEINANRIAELTQQGTPPHQIAMELGLYSQEQLDQLIQEELGKLMVQEEEVEVTIDFWKISRTVTYLERAKTIANSLNLPNSIIFHPSNKVTALQSVDEQGQPLENNIDQNIVTQILNSSLKGERRNMTKKCKLTEFKDVQTKRLINYLMKQTTTHPFSYELVFMTNRNVDLEQFAKKFALQQTPLHIFCLNDHLTNYYNIGGLTGGQVKRIDEENLAAPVFKIRAIISNEYKFVESDASILETEVSDFNEFQAQIVDNVHSEFDGFVQIIVYQHDGNCTVQQIQIDRNQLGEPNISNTSVSTLKLTEYSKY